MKFSCPKCQKKYNIPDAKVPSRDTKATCTACSHSIPIKGKVPIVASASLNENICPKCGLSSKKTKECTACGVIFSEYIEEEESKAQKSGREKPVVRKSHYYIEGFGEMSWASLKALVAEDKIDHGTGIFVGRTSMWVTACSMPTLFSKQKSIQAFFAEKKRTKLFIVLCVLILTSVGVSEIYTQSQRNSYSLTKEQSLDSFKETINRAIFGIPLGKPFLENFTECEYGVTDQPICYTKTTPTKLLNGLVKIKVPSPPIYMDWDGIYCRVYNGNIEGFKIKLYGQKYEAKALEALTDKWGEPTQLEPVFLTNGFGAKFSSFEASWSLGDLNCFFTPATSRARYIIAYTQYGLKREVEEMDKYLKKGTKL